MRPGPPGWAMELTEQVAESAARIVCSFELALVVRQVPPVYESESPELAGVLTGFLSRNPIPIPVFFLFAVVDQQNDQKCQKKNGGGDDCVPHS